MAAQEQTKLLELRPRVPMGAFHGLGYVCVLGAAEGLRTAGVDAGIGWPFAVVDAGSLRLLAQLRVRAGYDEGMYATCEVTFADDVPEAEKDALLAGIRQRVDAWEADVIAGRGAAGPVAPVLEDYFDAVPLVGRRVAVRYPNGNLMATATFAGMDVWGRATLRLDDGRELELAPEQGRIESAEDVR